MDFIDAIKISESLSGEEIYRIIKEQLINYYKSGRVLTSILFNDKIREKILHDDELDFPIFKNIKDIGILKQSISVQYNPDLPLDDTVPLPTRVTKYLMVTAIGDMTLITNTVISDDVIIFNLK